MMLKSVFILKNRKMLEINQAKQFNFNHASLFRRHSSGLQIRPLFVCR